jgi:adenine deaminase
LLGFPLAFYPEVCYAENGRTHHIQANISYREGKDMLLIQNGYIKTMAGADIENGAVLIDDNGKIAAVGTDLVAPSGARVIDAGGRLVTPGCVEAQDRKSGG